MHNGKLIGVGLPLFYFRYGLHELMKKKYPDKPKAYGIPYTGLSNARPETKAIGEHVKRNIKNMPFAIKEYLELEIPGSKKDPDFGK